MMDDTVDLWALDEVHFQQQGSRCRMWIPPELKDPIVYHHPTRKSVGYFAAVRLRDGQFLFRRETGRFNGETFWQFLKMFQEASAVPGQRVLAISDNAQYHRSKLHRKWRDQQAPQFGLDFLLSTTATSASWKVSLLPLKISSPRGPNPTILYADYAQLLKTLSLAAQQRRAET
ncbi:MAG: transposase [Candidatus Sulfotelmatobacter sp.]